MRHGPKVRAIYSCSGCEFHRYLKTEAGDVGFACHEPGIVAVYDVPQFVPGMRDETPRWCPYREGEE